MRLRLKALRANVNMSQEAASKAMHVSKPTIISWEAERTFPSAEQVLRLCALSHCSPEDIMSYIHLETHVKEAPNAVQTQSPAD